MNMRKALLALLCVVAVVVGSVFGTLAYLTDSDAATNTFTVGNVQLKLTEKDVDNDTNEDDNEVVDGVTRDRANAYHMLPGITHEKDPMVTVLQNSEDCYVRMIVQVENLSQLKAALPKYEKDAEGNDLTDKPIAANAKYYNGNVFLLQMLCYDENGCTWDEAHWKFETFHDENDPKYPNTYEFRYIGNQKDAEDPTVNLDNGIVMKNDAAAGTVLEPLFTHITVPGEVDNAHLQHLQNVKIHVTAHAIQSAGFVSDQNGAWTAFDGQNS